MSGRLKSTLEKRGLADLAEAIDWEVTPKRGVFMFLFIGLFYYLAAMFLLLLAFGPALTFSGGSAGGARLIGQFITGPLALVITIPFFRHLGGLWNQQSAKFPELALFAWRKPVLYLRRFSAENPQLAQDAPMRLGLLKLSGPAQFERAVERGVKSIGQLVCLGDPRFQRSTGRVARLYAQDQKWRQAVGALARVSDLVFIHYVPGGSIEWEVETFLNDPRRSTLIWVDPADMVLRAGETIYSKLPAALRLRLEHGGGSQTQITTGDGGWLFGVANGLCIARRVPLAGQALVFAVRKALKDLSVKPTYSDNAPAGLAGLRLIERSPLVFALSLPVVLVFGCSAWVNEAQRPEREWQAHWRQGDVALAEGRWPDAEAAFGQAIQIPNAYQSSSFSGRCFARAAASTDLAGANADCMRAAELGGGGVRLSAAQSILALRESRDQEAFNHADGVVSSAGGALAYNDFYATPLFLRGVAHCRLGRIELGEADITAAVALRANVYAGMTELRAACDAPRPLPEQHADALLAADAPDGVADQLGDRDEADLGAGASKGSGID